MAPRPGTEASLRIESARTAADFSGARLLFEEYAGSLGFDLGFQEFEKELSLKQD